MAIIEVEKLEWMNRVARQIELYSVAPKMELFRAPCRIKIAKGGRGAGAKSWSIASLLCQIANKKRVRILCTREIQTSLDESVHELIKKTIERLGLPGWTVQDNKIYSRTGSEFIFKGLRDSRAAMNVKGYEDIDIAWCEEAQMISKESLDLLVPTIRKPRSELWFSYNPETELDAVAERFERTNRLDVLLVELKPGRADNPWFPDELLIEMEEDFKRDPDLAEHIWHGLPRKQGVNVVLSRADVRSAMNRNIGLVGTAQIGVDVARFGDDSTTIFKRIGMKTVSFKKFKGQDTMRTAKEAWSLAGHDPSIPILVDVTGIGAGVVDRLSEMGAKVIGVDFGGKPDDDEMYADVITEMHFNFKNVLDEADIPDDSELMRQLTGRRYGYDRKNRYKVESKDEYKKRLGCSPDDSDGILLCYYNPTKKIFPDDIARSMAKRHGKK
ncbi:MAG: PBSX family phage terminase large subunit [Cyclobacteriaceae bacterium]